MGRRGPPPTPTPMLKLRGSWRADVNRAEPQPEMGKPKCPDWIDVYAKAAWKQLVPQLEQMGVLKMTISQNVDDLHARAGSKALAEIHGNRTKMRCIGCEGRWHRDEFHIREYPPRCPDCDDLVKSDTVMFGEPIPVSVLDVCFRETQRADCMVVIGTSATVYPAADFPRHVKRTGGFVIEANPNETPLSDISDATLRGPTGESLPLLVRRVREIKGT